MINRLFSSFSLAWLMLAAAIPALSQQVYLRTPGTNYCNVTDASNTTPLRLTVSNTCGLSNGAVVLVSEVRGNTAANVHLNHAADTANLARKVANLAGNSFDLLDLDDNPVPGLVDPTCSGAPSTHQGTCTYTGGGRVGLAAPHALRPHPILFFDGPTGTRTAGLLSAANKANSANPSYDTVLNMAATYISNYGQRWGYEQFNGNGETQGIGVYTIASALRWKLTGDTAARDAAVFSLGDNPDQVLGTPACEESDGNCAAPASWIMDYPMQFGQTYYQAYSLLHDELSPAQRAKFLGFFLSDLPWYQGGLNYSGTALVKPAFTKSALVAGGTITLSTGSTAITGVDTTFTTQCASGAILVSNKDVYGHPYRIVSIESDTALTIDAPAVETATGANFSCGPRWDPSMYGYLWHQKHMQYNPLNGSGTSGSFGQGVVSPYYGSLSGLYQDGFNNHSLVRSLGMFGIGLATCGDDPRGCLLASLADEFLYDEAMPYILTVWTGFSWAGNTYHQVRITSPIVRWANWRMNSLVSAPDPLAGTDVRQKVAMWMPWAHVPQWNHLPTAESAWFDTTVLQMQGSIEAMGHDPEASYSRNLQWWLKSVNWFNPSGLPDGQRYPYGPQAVSHAGSSGAWEQYLIYEPTISQLPITATTAHFTENNQTACVARYGAEHCTAPDVRRVSVSRSDWTDTATYVAVNSTGFGCRDHCFDELGGYFYIFKNRQALIANDSTLMMGSIAHRGYPLVGSVTTLPQQYDGGYFGTPTLWTAGAEDFMFVRTNLLPIYEPAAHVTAMERQIFHLKGDPTADYVVDHIKGSFSSPQLFQGLQHYNLNGCGTPNTTTCVTLNPGALEASHIQSTINHEARLNSKVFGLSGPMTIATASGDPSDGSYPGGAGASFRWHVTPAAGNVADVEYMVVHQPTSNLLGVLPPITQSINGVFRQLEIQDPVEPKFLAFTAQGVQVTSISFTTTHAGTGRYVVTGLAAGLYDIRRGGLPLGNPLPVAASSHALSFSGLSGSFEITQRTALTILTPTLPNAVIGRPYTAVISAAATTAPPYSWDILSGTLCDGLTFTPGTDTATFQGTAQTLQTCTFVVRAITANLLETDTRQFSITVQSPDPVPLTLLTTQIPAPRVNDFYSYRLRSSGGTQPVSWSISSGDLCPGLSLAPNGEISGVAPLANVSCTFTARVTDLGAVFQERLFLTIGIDDAQASLHWSGIEASHTGAVLRLGRRYLPFDQSCTVDLRLGGPAGSLLQTLSSAQGASRRQFIATGLPAGQLIHAAALCGAESAEAQFTTSPAPAQPLPVYFRLPPPTLRGLPVDMEFSYGSTPSVPNIVIAPCTSLECSTVVDTAAPLLYWRVRYRDANGATLAESALNVRAPR